MLARVGETAPEMPPVRAPGLWDRLLAWRGGWRRTDDLHLLARRRNAHLLRDIGLDRSDLITGNKTGHDLWY